MHLIGGVCCSVLCAIGVHVKDVRQTAMLRSVHVCACVRMRAAAHVLTHARAHVACQSLRVELAQVHMTCVHHEHHAHSMEARAKQMQEQRASARESCAAAELDARLSAERAEHRYLISGIWSITMLSRRKTSMRFDELWR